MRSIGVSNFSVENLEILLKHATIIPVNNQVEVHPCLPQFELQKYCEEKGILLTAYSPLGMWWDFLASTRSSHVILSCVVGQGHQALLTEPDFVKIAEGHGATTAQISISWLLQRGIPPLVKSANVERMKSNKTVCLVLASTLRLSVSFVFGVLLAH